MYCQALQAALIAVEGTIAQEDNCWLRFALSKTVAARRWTASGQGGCGTCRMCGTTMCASMTVLLSGQVPLCATVGAMSWPHKLATAVMPSGPITLAAYQFVQLVFQLLIKVYTPWHCCV